MQVDLDRVIVDELPRRPREWSDDDEAEFNRLAAQFSQTIPYCPWEPNPGPQTLF
jgi:hypothetical protein